MSVDIETPLRRTWALSHLDMRDMCAAGLVQVVGGDYLERSRMLSAVPRRTT